MTDICFDGIPAITYGLQLTRCSITPPVRKTELLEIPGADGAVDLLKGMGPDRYERREILAEFTFCGDPKPIMERVVNILAERELTIVLPHKSDCYILGTVHILGSGADQSGGCTMKIDAMPWLLRRNMMVLDVPAAEDPVEIILYNQGLREAVPEVIASGPVRIVCGTAVIDFPAGAFLAPELTIDGFGQRAVSVSGAGCTIQFREAVLL